MNATFFIYLSKLFFFYNEKYIPLIDNISMGNKLRLNSQKIANLEFKVSPKGYDPLQVDQLLDDVIRDYEVIESKMVVYDKEENASMNNQIEELKKQVVSLTVELEKEKSKWKYVKGNTGVSEDNYELLKRIGKLEKIIFEKLHLNPEEIKTFDPDDY